MLAGSKTRNGLALKPTLPEMPIGNFPAKIKGVDSVTIVPQSERAYSIVFCYADRPGHHTFTLCRDGSLLANIPRHLRLKRKQILTEVLRIAASQNGNGGGPASTAGPILSS